MHELNTTAYSSGGTCHTSVYPTERSSGEPKRPIGDDAEMPSAKRARPDLQPATPTPLALQNKSIVSPGGESLFPRGEELMSPIEPRKRSRMPNARGAQRGNAAPPEHESPSLLRRATDPNSVPGPVLDEQSPASPSPSSPLVDPVERRPVNQATKNSRVRQWLQNTKVPKPKILLTPPTSISSFSLGRSTPSQPTVQPSPTRSVPAKSSICNVPAKPPTCNVPAKKPTEVEVISISSDSSSEAPSDMSEHQSLHSAVSASKSASKKQGSEYESAHELLSANEGAHIEGDNAGEMTIVNGSKSDPPDLDKKEETTPRHRVALDMLASIC
ncbi:unnamed protein product [Clonostachys rosea]|uniref:Uncharacterized protein n=1 Tax=Bionectria ochroleuca TaxID=29856 RepID=A0ABY6U9Z6_BIOOC|nr:unnamed protein product [Clonostachys rosea]